MSDEHQRTAVIITGGAPLLPAAVEHLPLRPFVIAADSGLDHAREAGLRPHLVVGDLDSVRAEGVAWAREAGVPIEEYPPDKDATDTELALGTALARGFDDLVLIGGGGDRLDHSMSALTALGHPSLARCSLEARWGEALIRVVHGPCYWEVPLSPGTTFSLLALHGACTGLTLGGARWPLVAATIEPGSSLGVSNVSREALISLALARGVLTMIVPHHFGGSV